MEECKEAIVDSFLNIGIFLDSEEDIDQLLISELLTDSLTFISFIVELEQRMNVEIPDEYLVQGKLEKVGDLVTLLNQIQENKVNGEK